MIRRVLCPIVGVLGGLDDMRLSSLLGSATSSFPATKAWALSAGRRAGNAGNTGLKSFGRSSEDSGGEGSMLRMSFSLGAFASLDTVPFVALNVWSSRMAFSLGLAGAFLG